MMYIFSLVMNQYIFPSMVIQIIKYITTKKYLKNNMSSKKIIDSELWSYRGYIETMVDDEIPI